MRVVVPEVVEVKVEVIVLALVRERRGRMTERMVVECIV